MKVNYGLKGPERKKLVEAISKELNTPAKYLGAPSFAYQVGNYTIDKDGLLEGEDNEELIKKLQDEYGLQYEEAELSSQTENDPYKDFLQEDSSNFSQGDFNLVIEISKEGFDEKSIENLRGLLKSKESLIKKALGVENLPLIIGEDRLSFPWFYDGVNPDEVKAYSHFISSLCTLAKSQSRVVVNEKPVANEKYAFRCFLLRLGFIGPEHKANRKILLSKLSGSSAFRDGQPANKEA